MRAFLTGIDGFAGRHLAARLAAEGHDVHGLALAPETVVPGAGRVLAADVRDAGAVASAIAEARPEAVVHLAGQTSNAIAFERPAETFVVNVIGTVNVLEACRAAGVTQVLLVTSGEVYGDRDPARPAAEDAPLAPITPYAASKAAQDLLGYQYWRTSGLAIVRARAYPHTGPGQSPGFVFPSVARRIALAEADRGPAEIELGRIDLARDVTDVRDVVGAYARLLECGAPGEAYNVCRGQARTLREWLEPFAILARTPVRFVSRRERFRPADLVWLAGDPSKIMETTGWRPNIAWEDTVRDLLEEWRVKVAEAAAVPAGGGRARA